VRRKAFFQDVAHQLAGIMLDPCTAHDYHHHQVKFEFHRHLEALLGVTISVNSPSTVSSYPWRNGQQPDAGKIGFIRPCE
jgi:hypothetical protein